MGRTDASQFIASRGATLGGSRGIYPTDGRLVPCCRPGPLTRRRSATRPRLGLVPRGKSLVITHIFPCGDWGKLAVERRRRHFPGSPFLSTPTALNPSAQVLSRWN